MVPRIAPDFIRNIWGAECKGALGMTFAPGRYNPKKPEIVRSLREDLVILREEYGMQTLVSFIEDEQVTKYRITEKVALCQKFNTKHYSFPIKDYSFPSDVESFKQFVKTIVDDQIRKDRIVISHCAAGLGRTGLFAAACLVYAGLSSQDSMKLVRSTRKGTIEVQPQQQFIKSLQF